jgi:NAD kinase
VSCKRLCVNPCIYVHMHAYESALFRNMYVTLHDCVLQVNRLFTGNVMMTLRMRLQCTLTKNNETLGPFHCLNEAVIDRGPSPYLSAIDLDCDDQYLTTVQVSE